MLQRTARRSHQGPMLRLFHIYSTCYRELREEVTKDQCCDYFTYTQHVTEELPEEVTKDQCCDYFTYTQHVTENCQKKSPRTNAVTISHILNMLQRTARRSDQGPMLRLFHIYSTCYRELPEEVTKDQCCDYFTYTQHVTEELPEEVTKDQCCDYFTYTQHVTENCQKKSPRTNAATISHILNILQRTARRSDQGPMLRLFHIYTQHVTEELPEEVTKDQCCDYFTYTQHVTENCQKKSPRTNAATISHILNMLQKNCQKKSPRTNAVTQ